MDTRSSDIYIPVHLRLNTPKQDVVVERNVMYPSRWWQKALPLPDDFVLQHNWFVIQNTNTATLQQTTCCVSATCIVCQVVTNYEATSMMLAQASPLTIKHTLHKAWKISQNCKTTCKQAHKRILAPTVKEQNTQLHCTLAHRLTLKLYSRKPSPIMCHGSLAVVAWWGVSSVLMWLIPGVRSHSCSRANEYLRSEKNRVHNLCIRTSILEWAWVMPTLAWLHCTCMCVCLLAATSSKL